MEQILSLGHLQLARNILFQSGPHSLLHKTRILLLLLLKLLPLKLLQENNPTNGHNPAEPVTD